MHRHHRPERPERVLEAEQPSLRVDAPAHRVGAPVVQVDGVTAEDRAHLAGRFIKCQQAGF